MPRLIVVEYQTPDSRTLVMDWLRALRDDGARHRMATRIDRLRLGLRGDWRPVGGAVFALRIDHGSGYRIYAAQDGVTLVVLLCAGDQRTQQRDIETAHAYWKDYQARR